MVIFLYGSDSYSRSKRLQEILKEYEKKYSGFSRDVFDLEEEEGFRKLNDFASQMLIFDNKKLAILKNAFSFDLKELRDFLKKYLEVKDITIIISEEKVAPPELKPVLGKSFLTEKYEQPKGEKFKFFIQQEAKKIGVKLSPPAVHFLADSFQGNIHGVVNEIEKAGLAFGDKEVKTSDLFEVGNYKESPNIFSFVNLAVSEGGVSKKITFLEELFLGQEEPAKVFNFISASKRISREMLEKLADYDVAVKSGKLEYDEVLLDLALS